MLVGNSRQIVVYVTKHGDYISTSTSTPSKLFCQGIIKLFVPKRVEPKAVVEFICVIGIEMRVSNLPKAWDNLCRGTKTGQRDHITNAGAVSPYCAFQSEQTRKRVGCRGVIEVLDIHKKRIEM